MTGFRARHQIFKLCFYTDSQNGNNLSDLIKRVCQLKILVKHNALDAKLRGSFRLTELENAWCCMSVIYND
jgi:hypothetical protein